MRGCPPSGRAPQSSATMPQIEAKPYAFPYDGDLDPAKTAVILIDMQVDFCGHGGYVDQMGYDINATRAPIEPLQRILKAARRTGCFIEEEISEELLTEREEVKARAVKSVRHAIEVAQQSRERCWPVDQKPCVDSTSR